MIIIMEKKYRKIKLDILKLEIGLVEEHIKHLDNLINRNRHFSIIIWVAIIIFSAAIEGNWPLFLASFIQLPFWMTEANYKK